MATPYELLCRRLAKHDYKFTNEELEALAGQMRSMFELNGALIQMVRDIKCGKEEKPGKFVVEFYIPLKAVWEEVARAETESDALVLATKSVFFDKLECRVRNIG
jgi:hypothetical protein